jgi:hypothetical protein
MKQFICSLFVAIMAGFMLMGHANAQTPTPPPTPTPFSPWPTFTPTPPPIPYTPRPDATLILRPTTTPIPDFFYLRDYHFIYPQVDTSDEAWAPAGGAAWSFSKYTIPVGGSIRQTVVTGTVGAHPFMITIRAQASLTSTFGVTVGGIEHTITITRADHMARNYSYTQTVSFPATVIVAVNSGGPVVFDRVQMDLADVDVVAYDYTAGYEHNPVAPEPMNVGSFVDWFTPIELHPVFTWDVASSDWLHWFTTITGPVAATMMQFMTPRVIHIYIAFRILLMCVLWMFGFVMQKIGKPIPPASGAQVITVGGANLGYSRYNYGGLPKLPPSGIRMGGGRRRRGGF